MRQASFRIALRNAIARGSITSWMDGAKAATRDLRYIERIAKIPAPAVELKAPWGTMAERADVTADHYSKAVRETAYKFETAGSKEPIREAVEAEKYRLRRAAATETSAWFNDGRQQTVTESMRRAGVERRSGHKLVEIWDSLLDACPLCYDMNGTQADRNGMFAGGLRPGWVHHYCRCSYHLDLEKGLAAAA